MSKYRWLLFDVDGTLLDFDKAEIIAYTQALRYFDLPTDKRIIDDYIAINNKYWRMLEREEIDKPTLLIARHRELFSKYNFTVDAVAFNRAYFDSLSQQASLVDGALKTLTTLQRQGKYVLAIITNGVYEIQVSRLSKSGLDKFFNHIFISEKVGYEKPNAKYFQYVFEHIEGIERSKTLIIGDSLTTDISGGANCNIDTCWINKSAQSKSVLPTYQIKDISQLLEVLQNS